MSTNDRRRRPPVERTHPVRSWAALLDGGARRASEADAPASDPAGRVTHAVSKSVEIGYRVIDDYLQQGQRVARRLSDGSSGAEIWATEIQDLGVRMARYASDFMAAWMELLELTARGGGGAPRPAARPETAGPSASPPAPAAHRSPGATSPAGPAPAAEPGARVRVAVRSRLPIEVDVDYRPERVGGPAVRAHALRAFEPEKPRIEGVSFRPQTAAEPATLFVHVPDDQPAGSYEGLLVDEATNRPVGSVRVDVIAPADETS
jgi:hypothetical protein